MSDTQLFWSPTDGGPWKPLNGVVAETLSISLPSEEGWLSAPANYEASFPLEYIPSEVLDTIFSQPIPDARIIKMNGEMVTHEDGTPVRFKASEPRKFIDPVDGKEKWETTFTEVM